MRFKVSYREDKYTSCSTYFFEAENWIQAFNTACSGIALHGKLIKLEVEDYD